MIRYMHHASPIGPLLLIANADGLASISMHQQKFAPRIDASWQRGDDHDGFVAARGQLDEYFAGKRTRFELKTAPIGTPFQLRVWELLRGIEFGHTRTYGQLAAALGQPTASRAVGAANGKNPLSIIVPCHRVIGSDGSLTGYAGGSERKQWLLDHESRLS